MLSGGGGDGGPSELEVDGGGGGAVVDCRLRLRRFGPFLAGRTKSVDLSMRKSKV